eukprot:9476847-Pyramimonas_sp.AAC.1
MCVCLAADHTPEDALECEDTSEGCFDAWASYAAYREESLVEDLAPQDSLECARASEGCCDVVAT